MITEPFALQQPTILSAHAIGSDDIDQGGLGEVKSESTIRRTLRVHLLGGELMSRREKNGEARKHGSVNDRPLTEQLFERISRRAYELYQLRGEAHGHDAEDWFEAERQVREDIAGNPEGPAR